MLYRTNFSFDDAAIVKHLDALAANYNLTSFVKIAVESYLATPEGQMVCQALAGYGRKKRAARGKKKDLPVAQIGVQRVHQENYLSGCDDRHKTVDEKPVPNTAPARTGLIDTAQVLGHIFKKPH